MAEEAVKHESGPSEAPDTIFTFDQKTLIVIIVSVAATFTGFASNIYFPAIPTIAADLKVSAELVNLTVTSYMIFQGLSPTLWGSLADVLGRRVTYICTFIIFLGACIGLANTQHYHQLVILRCMQSAGSASTVAIGAGVIRDITTRAERGSYMGYFQAGLLVPLAVSPILGGVFAETLGWRAIFWFLTIYAGAFLVVLILVSRYLFSHMFNDADISKIRKHQRRIRAQQVPRRSLTWTSLAQCTSFFSLEVTFAILFVSIYYTVWQMTVTVMSTLFSRTYGLSETQIGLTFIANGVGCIFGTLLAGKFLDFDYRRIQNSYNGSPELFPLEKARLRSLWLWSGLECAAILVFGWTLDRRVHISVPIICTFIIGWAATSIYGVASTYLVDVFPDRSASATAALNLSRCLIGAGGTAAVLPIANAINVGWTFTMLTGVMLVSLGLIVVQMSYGAAIRRKKTEAG